ncbi:Crp/Fnr family transcriptional regulator [Aquiflexum lacus]|uniref:Crp/Fnr family transcriptional regulator n=1 Tax=Aquiflexum lacus TaxID=2483805 RepID=UPI001895F81D|nr:Crp/Fnr family transcriptional regulator [Aquiflexum lacus]
MSDIFENLNTNNIAKGVILLHKGDMCKHAYKVISGCLKSYVIDKSGKEHILQFAPEDWYISDMDSFFNYKPSQIFIEAIEKTDYIKIGKTEFENLLNLESNSAHEQQLKLIRNIISTNKRLIGLLSSTAEERYSEFIETYPSLVQRIPLKLIASYIGITPEYLSELRKEISKK